MRSFYNNIRNLLHESSLTVSEKIKKMEFIIKNENIDEYDADFTNILICRYCIDTQKHIINWDVLYLWLFQLKKYNFKGYNFCTSTLNIVKSLYIALHYRYHSILFHFILIAYNNQYCNVTKNIINLLLDFNAYIVKQRIRYFYINKLISYIAEAYNKQYINNKSQIYRDFYIMFPKYINKLNSLILLNKLEV